MKKLFIIFLLMGITSVLPSTPQVSSTYEKIEEIIIDIRSSFGDILYSEQYYELKQIYQNLRERTAGRDLTEIENRDAAEILIKFEKIKSDAETSRPYLSSVLKAREEALANNSEDFAPIEFQKAESELHDIANRLRTENPARVERKIIESLQLFRQAQFQAIRNKLLSEVRILVRESQDLEAEKLAPRTLNLVLALLQDVENILDRKEFNDPSLQEKAVQLSAESQHLLYLVQITRRVQRDDAALEEFLLKLEESVRKIALLLNYDPHFSDGISSVLQDIQSSIRGLQEENLRLSEANQLLKDSLSEKNNEIINLKNNLADKDDFAKRVEQLQNNVNEYGVSVWQQGNEIILRLTEIQFEPGKITVTDEVKFILEIIGRSIREFPNSKILVRIGQEAVGNTDYNISLALQRAKSAALILQSAGYISDGRLHSEGILLPRSSTNRSAILEIIIDMNT
jgi:outer membrane protein OmpA-like peptidoglycan-associated protein